ncbi:alpha/beta hydrolase [Acidicapsa dinghuensis]|uniref:Alpha/beta hydrolase n=1 Tax=Acidicapsa dinghuensis TaxID=2218256 RepID=A0ABW1EP56_9BACT|nr:lysophospholipase [Acidicapsa dinghuensis]
MKRTVLWSQRIARILACSALAYLVLAAVFGVILAEGVLHVARNHVPPRAKFAALVSPWSRSGLEDVSIKAEDGAILRGWPVRPDRWKQKAVILLHGVGDNRAGMVSFAPIFLKNGYEVLIPDARGHGESGGSLATYGWFEKEDVRVWVAALKRGDVWNNAPQCVFLMGESMGAAIAVQAASVPGVCGVVAEAPFSSFREIAYERIAQVGHVPLSWSRLVAWPVVDAAFAYARLRYGIDFDRVSPQLALESTHAPVLLIAGLRDSNIPARHSKRIMASAIGRNELWLVPGAGHTDASRIEPVEFERRVLSWFKGCG